MRLILKLLVFTMVIGSFQSCVSKKKYEELLAAKEATDAALAETQANLATLQDEKDALAAEMESEKARLNGEISSIKSDLDATKSQMSQVEEKLSMTQKELDQLKAEIDGIFTQYSGSGLTLDERDGQLFIVTDAPVNYRSGSTYVDSDERKAIDALAEKLKANPALKVLIEGHTDDQGLIEGASFKDNWELGYARAMSVVRRLLRAGVNADQVSAVTQGDSAPVGDNDTSEGRAENRRTVVKPNLELGKMMKKN
ncbi:MAG: OmpA family protein [Bacteroidota bacterium]